MLVAPVECAERKPQVQPERPGLPCAMVYGLYALSSVCRAFWPPSPRALGVSCPSGPTSPSRGLTPASGCQDHTISPSASTALVSRSQKRPSLPASTSVTTRPPLQPSRDGAEKITSFRKTEAEYFWREVLT